MSLLSIVKDVGAGVSKTCDAYRGCLVGGYNSNQVVPPQRELTALGVSLRLYLGDLVGCYDNQQVVPANRVVTELCLGV